MPPVLQRIVDRGGYGAGRSCLRILLGGLRQGDPIVIHTSLSYYLPYPAPRVNYMTDDSGTDR